MSQQRRDSEKGTNDEKSSQHCSCPVTKSTSVISQLKTKVRRRTKNTTIDLSDSGSNHSLNNILTNSAAKRINQEEMDLTRSQSTTTTTIVSELRPTSLETIFSYDGTDPDLNSNRGMLEMLSLQWTESH